MFIRVLYTLLFIIYLQIQFARGQNFILSTVGAFPKLTAVSNPIYFKSNDACLDIQAGFSVVIGARNQGEFITNCDLPIKLEKINLQVFPNPGNEITYLRVDENISQMEIFQISIYTITGMLVYQTFESGSELHQGIIIDVSRLNEGGYFINISSKNFQSSQKFTKTNYPL
jgi:hypothetical protein